MPVRQPRRLGCRPWTTWQVECEDGLCWRNEERDDLADQRRGWAVQGNVAPVHVEPCKPECYTQCIPGHGASVMRPERRKCRRNGEADGSVELTRSGLPEAYEPSSHSTCQSDCNVKMLNHNVPIPIKFSMTLQVHSLIPNFTVEDGIKCFKCLSRTWSSMRYSIEYLSGKIWTSTALISKLHFDFRPSLRLRLCRHIVN